MNIEEKLNQLLICVEADLAGVEIFAPVPPTAECPICFLPVPLDHSQVMYQGCCGQIICRGCCIAHSMSKIQDSARRGLKVDSRAVKSSQLCAFCRQPVPSNPIKTIQNLMKRKDSNAFMIMAAAYGSGNGVPRNNRKSLEMFIEAAELGNAEAFVKIAADYRDGRIVAQDTPKRRAFLQIAAKKGSANAHGILGAELMFQGDFSTGLEHLKVAASAGDRNSLKVLIECFKSFRSDADVAGDDEVLRDIRSNVSFTKEDLNQTLRAFQNSNEQMKSEARDFATHVPLKGFISEWMASAGNTGTPATHGGHKSMH